MTLRSLVQKWFGPSPADPPTHSAPYDVTYLEIAPGVEASAFAALLETLSGSDDVQFFDPAFPSPSDPGGYMTARRSGDGFSTYGQNHGWTSAPKPVSAEALAQWMARSAAAERAAGEGPVRVRFRRW